MNYSDVKKEQFDLKNNNPKLRVTKSNLTYICPYIYQIYLENKKKSCLK